MSVAKPFVLLFLLEQLGTAVVFERVGVEPSAEPYNSLQQLQADRGWARNPMINTGAIALASLLPGDNSATRCNSLRLWLNQQAHCQLVVLDQLMLNSVLASNLQVSRRLH